MEGRERVNRPKLKESPKCQTPNAKRQVIGSSFFLQQTQTIDSDNCPALPTYLLFFPLLLTLNSNNTNFNSQLLLLVVCSCLS
ncbi:hypothetical protein ACE6H2_025641 [Prunus campanulata]